MFFTSLYIHRLNLIPPSLDTATSGGRYIPVLVVNTLVLNPGWFTFLSSFPSSVYTANKHRISDKRLSATIFLCRCGPRDEDRHSATRPVLVNVQQNAVIHVEPYPSSPLLVSLSRIKYPSAYHYNHSCIGISMSDDDRAAKSARAKALVSVQRYAVWQQGSLVC